MCKLGLVLLFSLTTGSSYAQGYFVLLQSGNRQPFYVRLGTQLYSSTQNGHLILSQLKDSTYTLAIGFASRPGVEQSYVVTPSQKDLEFEIRERGEAGWELYDMQAKEWLTAVSRSGGREEVRAIGVRRDDAFSRMMAGVVHDTAVLYNDYADSELAVVLAARRDTATAPITRIDTPVIKPETVAAAAGRPDSPASPKLYSSASPRSDSSAYSRSDSPAFPKSDSPASPKSHSPVVSSGIYTTPDSSVAANTRPDTAPITRPDTQSNSLRSDPPPSIDSSAREPLYRPTPSVVKLSERKLTRNMRLVYADKGKDAKSDTVVVIIPLDTPQTTAAKARNANPDSSRAAAVKMRNTVPDTSRIAAIKSRNAGPDTSRTAAKSRNAGPDSSRTAAKPRNAGPDSTRAAAVKPRTPDSARPASARSKAPNFDSPANVRAIVPTPLAQPADKNRPNDSAKKPATKSPLPYVNSDCHAFATDYDVDKLRVKMLEGAKDDERIAAALKIFKTKCFFTRQIKALSEVFTTDASKYRFFETAYPFAADEHFRELGALLTDPVNQNKFKTLVH